MTRKVVGEDLGTPRVDLVDHQVCVVSGYITTGAMPKWVTKTKSNHEQYCRKNGYHYMFHRDCRVVNNEPEQGIVHRASCSKFYYLLEALEKGYTYVIWMDPDSIFATQKPIPDVGDEGYSIIICGDEATIYNGGHLLCKNDAKAKAFLKQCITQTVTRLKIPMELKDLRLPITEGRGVFINDMPNLISVLIGGQQCSAEDRVRAYVSGVSDYRDKETSSTKFYLQLSPISKTRARRAQELVSRDYRQVVCIKEQRFMNSYLLHGAREGIYTRGDWMIHIVGPDKRFLGGLFWYRVGKNWRYNVWLAVLMRYGVGLVNKLSGLKGEIRQVVRRME